MPTQTVVKHLTGDMQLGLAEIANKVNSLGNAHISLEEVNGVVTRTWADHASAQEYIDFANSLATTYNFTIETTITDI